MDESRKIDALAAAAKAFSPSAPIDQRALFSGRIAQLTEVMNAISQRGQHVALFGERGVGKTSLARIIAQVFRSSGVAPEPVNCDASSTFSELWGSALRGIVHTTQKDTVGFRSEPTVSRATLRDAMPPIANPDDVRHALAAIGQCIIVFDEFDRIVDNKVRASFADTIKNLSDHAIPATVILVGVADSVDALIAEHHSVERALVQIRMPRMSIQELYEIIDKGVKQCGITMTYEARSKIAVMSQGLPHYTHLLSLHAAQSAIANGSEQVTTKDVRAAIDMALAKAQQTIINGYHRATSSPRENLYKQVLLACALADADVMGYFAAMDLREPMSRIMGKRYDIPAFSQHLNSFCESGRGPILQRTGERRRFRFRFINPLMQPYVIMEGIRQGLITEGNIGGTETTN